METTQTALPDDVYSILGRLNYTPLSDEAIRFNLLRRSGTVIKKSNLSH